MSVMAEITVFLCGDVMTGRGIDQVLAHSCPPHLYEPVVTSAREYVTLAERAHGPIARGMTPAALWGAALDHLAEVRPDVRIINLETSITTSEDAEPKGINYRMHPQNATVLTALETDCCVLANNHVLDWGEAGLLETLETLDGAGVAVAGAGRHRAAARAPAILPLAGKGRLLVFAVGGTDSGIPSGWAATELRPGINLLDDYSEGAARGIGEEVAALRAPGDLVIVSIHWGNNWGYRIPEEHRRFAHALLEQGSVDAIHGHSSHHPRSIEIYRGRPILYGCGDFFNDYEGIGGYEAYRDDLVLMYFLTFAGDSGHLLRLEMTPLQIRNFRLRNPSPEDREWLRARLERECRRFGHQVTAVDGRFRLAFR
jgi:poly-gamma-glutamate capsule biosynthesis protein CapA/YwtB (metallophosphatase superfamily)